MKVLVVKTSSMGDILHTLPAISEAKIAIPKIEFDWVVEESFAEIPSWHSAVKQAIPIALRRLRQEKSLSTLQELCSFLHVLRAKKYDCIIDAQGLIKSALVTALAHGSKYGFAFNAAREKLASFFYSQKFDITKKLHAIERLRELFAKALGYEVKNPIDYGIKSFFSLPKPLEKYLVFVHGASHPAKCINVSQWIELAQLAQTQGFSVKLPWGNDLERQRAITIATACANAQILPKTSLHGLAQIFLGSTGVIAIDTGLGHLAAALDVPIVSLYQTTDPALIGTVGTLCAHIQNPANIAADAILKKIVHVSKCEF